MATVEVVNTEGKKVGEIALSDEVFGAAVNEPLLYEIVKAQLASRRAGSACSKIRAEVAGSTRKIYRQKGTGRARHGAITAPIFVGGGKAHGPRPRSYAYRPTRKMRLGALRSALSLRLKEKRLVVLDAFALEAPKTKAVQALVSKVTAADRKTLIVDTAENEALRLSARNLAKHQYMAPEGVNVYDLLRHDYLVLSRAAVEALEARCLRRRESHEEAP